MIKEKLARTGVVCMVFLFSSVLSSIQVAAQQEPVLQELKSLQGQMDDLRETQKAIQKEL